MKLWNCAGLGLLLAWGAVSFVCAQESTVLAKRIGLLPWKDLSVVRLSPQTDSRILIVAHYRKAGVVEDEDRGYVSFSRPLVEQDKDGKPTTIHGDFSEMRSKNRDGMHGWCDGVGSFEQVSSDGFDYALDLNWQHDDEKQQTFKKTFRCRWVEQQEFEQDGFKVTVCVTVQ